MDIIQYFFSFWFIRQRRVECLHSAPGGCGPGQVHQPDQPAGTVEYHDLLVGDWGLNRAHHC